MIIKMTSSGLKELPILMKRYAKTLPRSARAGTWNFAQHLAKMLREAAPLGFSGRMKSTEGTYAEKISKNNYVIKMPIYTKYLERGTGPAAGNARYWTNKPKVRNWAASKGAVGVGWYKLRSHIYQHGTKPHPFTARVIRTELDNLKEIVEERINEAIKKR